jgi:hypothetical protein
VERFLQAKGWNAAAIHGDMTQDARTHVSAGVGGRGGQGCACVGGGR